MNKFYFTLSANHAGGPGCVEVIAEDYEQARARMHEIWGNRWAFQYTSLEDVHPRDRNIVATIWGAE